MTDSTDPLAELIEYEQAPWRLRSDNGILTWSSEELDAVNVLWPTLDIDPVLSPDDFHAAFRRMLMGHVDWDEDETKRSLDAESAEIINRVLGLWRAKIDDLQAEIDRWSRVIT
jgi:hypothetical protein